MQVHSNAGWEELYAILGHLLEQFLSCSLHSAFLKGKKCILCLLNASLCTVQNRTASFVSKWLFGLPSSPPKKKNPKSRYMNTYSE